MHRVYGINHENSASQARKQGGPHRKRTASSRVDDNLVKAVATAHGWWEELLQNPERRISDLARTHGLTKSWITRTLRPAFLDPAITEMILAGKAPAHLTQRALRSEESVPAVWADQRARHRINATIWHPAIECRQIRHLRKVSSRWSSQLSEIQFGQCGISSKPESELRCATRG